MRRFLVPAVVAGVLAIAAPAMAGDLPYTWIVPKAAPDTPGFIREFVVESQIMQPTPAEWAPQGRLIADTGFRPERDGMGMLNWSNSDDSLAGIPTEVSHYYLGFALRDAVNLQNSDVPRVIGREEACVAGLPGCTLTHSARVWREGVNGSMAGGHCFGIATTVAQIYNGMIPKSSIGATTSVYRADWSPTLMRQVARAFSTQYLVDLDQYTLSPREVVEALKRDLRPGYTPYTAAIRATNGEGHGVTPIALYDRGNGLYDVAVYDNNYPGRTRAFHIDTVKNTFEYLMFTLPGQGPLMAEGNMQLVPVEDLLPRNLPCAFCAGGDEVTVSVPPIQATGKITTALTRPDGSPIRGMKVIPPTNPSSLVGYQSFPTYVVPAGTRFRLTVTSTDDTVHTTPVTLTTGSEHFGPLLDIRPDSTTTFTYAPNQSKVTIQASRGTEGLMIAGDLIGSTQWKFAAVANSSPGVVQLGPNQKLSMAIDVERYRITMERFRGKPQEVNFLADAVGSAGTLVGLSQNLTWGSGDRVEFRYRKFTDASFDGLNATLIAQDGTRTTLSFTAPPT
jgi:hypothetical protein